MFNHIKTDPELCIGCKTCMAACVASHTGKALFAMKPNSFDFTPRVHVVYTSKITKAVQCQQCPKPRCLDACPFNCISLGEDSVVIDEDACRGCGKCSKACPFDAITMTRIYHGNTQAAHSESSLINATFVKTPRRENRPASLLVRQKP